MRGAAAWAPQQGLSGSDRESWVCKEPKTWAENRPVTGWFLRLPERRGLGQDRRAAERGAPERLLVKRPWG